MSAVLKHQFREITPADIPLILSHTLPGQPHDERIAALFQCGSMLSGIEQEVIDMLIDGCNLTLSEAKEKVKSASGKEANVKALQRLFSDSAPTVYDEWKRGDTTPYIAPITPKAAKPKPLIDCKPYIEGLRQLTANDLLKHDYAKKKHFNQLNTNGLLFDSKTNEIIVPRQGVDGKLVTYQRIASDGKKLSATGVSTTGSFFIVGGHKLDKDKKLFLCEGLATGLAVDDVKPPESLVVCAMDKGNLKALIKRLSGGGQGQVKVKTSKVKTSTGNDCTTRISSGSDSAPDVIGHGDLYVIADNDEPVIDIDDIKSLIANSDKNMKKSAAFFDWVDELDCLIEQGTITSRYVPRRPGSDFWDDWLKELVPVIPNISFAEGGKGCSVALDGMTFDNAVSVTDTFGGFVRWRDAGNDNYYTEHPFTGETLSIDGQDYHFEGLTLLSPASLRRMASKPIPMVIDGILPKDGLGQIIGKSGCGKTFVALDMAFCIAHGLDWNGRATIQGSVVFILGEGLSGFGQRISALEKKYGIENTGIYASKSAVMLDNEAEAKKVQFLLDELRPAVVFIDTLAKNFEGDENVTRDANTFINNVSQYVKTSGGLAVWVHHISNKAGSSEKGGRGSSSFYGGVDTEIKVSRKDDQTTISSTKQKDGKEFEPIRMRMIEGVEISGSDNTSVYLEYIDPERVIPSDRDEALVKSFSAVLSDKGQVPSDELAKEFELSDKVVLIEDLRNEFYNSDCFKSDDKQDTKRQVFHRSKKSLIKKFDYQESGGYFFKIQPS